VAPLFPEIARRLSITGAVKVEALVLPNGAVKSVDIKGGHPLLAQSASDAVRKWKWEPAAHETREVVEIRFDPRN
jgi:TonB family protein